MKTALLTFLLTLSAALLAQWQGDTARYIISDDGIQLNDSIAGSAYLSKASDIIEDASWELRLQMAFNPSSSNYACIYLVAENSQLSGPAYYVKVGDTDDDVSLYRQDAASSTKIIDGTDDRVDLSAVDIKIKVSRQDGLWTLYTDPDNGGYQLEGQIEDDTYLESAYFGLKSVYTKTRADKFTYSDISISGEAFSDNVPPRLDSLIVLNAYQCRLFFNEAIAADELTANGQEADSIGVEDKILTAYFSAAFPERDSFPITYSVKDENLNSISATQEAYYLPFEVSSVNMVDSIHLYFSLNKSAKTVDLSHITIDGESPAELVYSEGKYILTLSQALSSYSSVWLEIKGIEDLNGDLLKDFSQEITYFSPAFGDVVFNEIMADPSPSAGTLPEEEYLEIYNASPFSINLEDWTLTKDDSHYTFPSYQLEAGAYLLIGKDEALSAFSTTLPQLAFSSFPALTNSGMSLELYSPNGTLIDLVDYEDDWHSDSFKANGGFSLERIDVYNPSQINNWTSSMDEDGGTPGAVNSVAGDNPDNEPPSVLYLYAIDSSSLMLEISEPIWSENFQDTSFYQLSDELSISAVTPQGEQALSSQAVLHLASPMTLGVLYEISVEGLSDLSDNAMAFSEHQVALCRLAQAYEVVINELMFYPQSGEAEYIEIYNNTTQPFDLSTMQLSQRAEDNTWESGKSLSEQSRLLVPEAYMVITDDAESLLQEYEIDEAQIIDISSLPTLANEDGNIALLLNNATLIDELSYSDDWHSSLLNDTRGVALERLNPSQPSQDAANWFSASSLCNYGTPGQQNSQYKAFSSSALETHQVSIEPEVFTPDGDGTDDLASLIIGEGYEGSTLRVRIFNQRGMLVRELLNNATIGTQNIIHWDGSDSAGTRCPMGPYIFIVEIITPDGQVINEKLELVLSARVR